jgi:hypothetical protein
MQKEGPRFVEESCGSRVRICSDSGSDYDLLGFSVESMMLDTPFRPSRLADLG